MSCGNLKTQILSLLVIILSTTLFSRVALALDPKQPTAQQFLENWTTENGLPQNSINDILQTRDGYLWLATFGGLVRFDGARFVVFDRSIEGIKSQRIKALCEDSKGTLWAGTEEGMLIRYRDGMFTTHDISLSCTGPTCPTAVTLAFFNAIGYDDGVLLQWQTGYEADNLGFNIYREEAGKRTLVNQQLVAGSALRDGSGLQAGESCSWRDTGNVDCGSRNADCQRAHYWLEDVDLKGSSTCTDRFQ